MAQAAPVGPITHREAPVCSGKTPLFLSITAPRAARRRATGPYMYDGQKENEIYTFVRNPYYDRGESDVDVFHVKVIPDNDAKVLALRNGEIDMIVGQANLTYNTFEELSTAPGFTAVSSDATIQSRTMGFNVSHAPFNDPAVRLAANHAIDTQSISTNIFYGVETPRARRAARSST